MKRKRMKERVSDRNTNRKTSWLDREKRNGREKPGEIAQCKTD